MLSFDAVGDGETDDTAAVIEAFAAGVPLSGQGRTYAVSGNITMPDGLVLQDCGFKQLTPGPATYTLTKVSGSGPLTLRRVKVDRNDPTGAIGVVATAGAIEISNINNVFLEDVEVTGDGPGHGIFLKQCVGAKLIRFYAHDIRFTRATAPGSEQVAGISMLNCVNVEIIDPRIEELTGSIAGGPYEPRGFGDGIGMGNCRNVSVRGGYIKRSGDGTDVTGSFVNENVWFYGVTYDECSYGQKFIHEAMNCGSVGCRAYRCALAGLVVGGTQVTTDHAHGPRNLRITNFIAIDTGYGGYYQDVYSVIGITINSGDYTDNPELGPQNVILTDCTSVDTQVAQCTISIASPGVVTKTAHDKEVGDRVYFTVADLSTLPTGLALNTMYYVQSVPTADTFTVSASDGGAAINTSGSVTGTQYCSMPTMEYGIRNETKKAVQAKFANPYTFGAKLDDWADRATESVWVQPTTGSIPNGFMVASGGIGTAPTWSAIFTPRSCSRRRAVRSLLSTVPIWQSLLPQKAWLEYQVSAATSRSAASSRHRPMVNTCGSIILNSI